MWEHTVYLMSPPPPDLELNVLNQTRTKVHRVKDVSLIQTNKRAAPAPACVNNGSVWFGASLGVYSFALCFESTICKLRFLLFLSNYFPAAHLALCKGVLCRLRLMEWLSHCVSGAPVRSFSDIRIPEFFHFSFRPSAVAGLPPPWSRFVVWLSGPFTSEFSSPMHEHMARSITDAGRCNASCPLRWMLINAMRCGGNA